MYGPGSSWGSKSTDDMTPDDEAVALGLDARMRGAMESLRMMIGAEYPSATFRLSRGPDDADPGNADQVLLWATVDLDDPEEVLDFIGDYLWQLEIEECIIIHVIPLRTPERVIADLQMRDAARSRRDAQAGPLTSTRRRASS